MTVVINGTTGISGVDGSAATPALQGGDTNTGIIFGTDTVGVSTGGVQRTTVDSSGRLLVGTSTARGTGTLQVIGGDEARPIIHRNLNDSFPSLLVLSKARGTGNQLVSNGDQVGYISFDAADGNTATTVATIQAIVDGVTGVGDTPGRLVFSTTADGASSPTERCRIASDGAVSFTNGSVRINRTGAVPSFASVLAISYTTGSLYGIALQNTAASTFLPLVFVNSSGSAVGEIISTTTSTSYSTSSDYRLKENVVAVTDGISRLQQLKPSRFNFIVDPSKTVDGFIAHEVQEVVPEAIAGEKDAIDEEGNPKYQGIDQSKLVPLLTAALQEAVTKIEDLEARLTAAGI